MEPVNLFEYEARAAELLERVDLDYIAGGGGDEITLRRTREVLDSVLLRVRVLTGVDAVDLTTTVLGSPVALPVLLAPAGFHHRAHPDGELATVRAAGDAGTVMVLSSGSSRTLEEVAAAATGPVWFQQYLYTDPGLTGRMAARAAAAGAGAVCVTLDAGLRAMRERDVRNGFVQPISANYGAERDAAGHGPDVVVSDAPRGAERLISRTAGWDDLAELAAASPLPLVAKGIMTAEDARAAADHGARAVVVSNHGARQVDTTYTSLEALPEVVDAVGDRVEVYLDGGIRRGTDVLKALALGARAVLVGRPVFWGLAVGGDAGLRRTLALLADELGVAMQACGVASVREVPAGVVGFSRPFPVRAPTG